MTEIPLFLYTMFCGKCGKKIAWSTENAILVEDSIFCVTCDDAFCAGCISSHDKTHVLDIPDAVN